MASISSIKTKRSAEHLQNQNDVKVKDIQKHLGNSHVTCIKSDDFSKICKTNASEYVEEKDLIIFNQFDQTGNFKVNSY